MSLSFVLLALNLSQAATQGTGTASVDPPVTDLSIIIHADRPERQVPERFLGLSIEKEQLRSGELDPRNLGLSRLLKGLGEGTLRIGGSSTEYTSLVRDPARTGKAKHTIRSDDVKKLFRFAKSVRWKVIYSLNLGQYAPDSAAEEAKYVTSVSRGALLAFEIGNEPDMFPLLGYRDSHWNRSSFIQEFEAYRAALQTSVPKALLSGPGVGNYLNGPSWLTPLVQSEPGTLAFASTHFYPMVRADGLPAGVAIPESSPAFPTIGHLLDPRFPAWVFKTLFVPQMRASAAAKLPFRVTEINSVARGGKTGVSDVFASALWILDYSFRFLELGADGIDVTTDLPTGSVYSAIQVENGVHVARPIYYGMLCFHYGAQGRLVPAEIVGDALNLNFSAYSTAGPGAVVRVTLINKDEKAAVRIHVHVLGAHSSSASVFRLTAPSLDARTGVQFAESAVADDGTWRPARRESIEEEAGVYTVLLPPASACVLATR